MYCEYISVKCNMYNIRIFQSDRFLRGTEGFCKQLDGQFRRHYQNIAAAVAVSFLTDCLEGARETLAGAFIVFCHTGLVCGCICGETGMGSGLFPCQSIRNRTQFSVKIAAAHPTQIHVLIDHEIGIYRAVFHDDPCGMDILELIAGIHGRKLQIPQGLSKVRSLCLTVLCQCSIQLPIQTHSGICRGFGMNG